MANATARLQVHPATVTSAVDRLERDGLLNREPHPHDGRASVLDPTDAGRALAEDATGSLNDLVFSQVALAGDELRLLNHVIARLRLEAGDFIQHGPLPDPL